uniref:Uncharacterized protein n=1 Tax=blood disease bacterium R229 TaxID=741978 RepID=G2ZSC2_9RALS|nr:conserved hypothetical protein [blood disease bacterium R229]
MPFARFFAYFHGLGNVYVSVRFFARRRGAAFGNPNACDAMVWRGDRVRVPVRRIRQGFPPGGRRPGMVRERDGSVLALSLVTAFGQALFYRGSR